MRCLPVSSAIHFLVFAQILPSMSKCVASDPMVEADNEMAPTGGGIRWKNLSVAVKSRKKKKKHEQLLLHPSTHHVENGSVCGILGPSGAGKSTLLAALSSTTLKSSGLQVSGAVWMDEEVVGGSYSSQSSTSSDKHMDKAYLSTKNGEVAFLHQSDAFFSMLTPRETLGPGCVSAALGM